MFSLAENTYTTQQREDSLLSLLKSSPTVDEQIELYKDLATMYRQTPKEIVYLNKMADVASSTLKGHASLSDYPFMHLLYSQLLVCQRVCLQNTVCLICK